jgi:hypothetical protein
MISNHTAIAQHKRLHLKELDELVLHQEYLQLRLQALFPKWNKCNRFQGYPSGWILVIVMIEPSRLWLSVAVL